MNNNLDITLMARELTPFEHLVAKYLCAGMSNRAIASKTGQSEKIIENTISRMARVFNILSGPDINLRMQLSLAYRCKYGDESSSPYRNPHERR